MVTNRLNSNRLNRKSLQLSTLSDATELPIKPTLPIIDAIRGRNRDGMTILLVAQNAYAALAIAD
jgi:hypothetical protein